MPKAAAAKRWQPIRAGLSAQTLRERWNRTMHFLKPDRLPDVEFRYWKETLPAWHAQGLPKSVNTWQRAYAYFGIERWRAAPVNVGLCPVFRSRIVKRGKDYVLWRDMGRALRMEKVEGDRSIPHYVEYGIKNRDDWKLFKERLNPDAPGRYPKDWARRVRGFRKRDYPLAIRIGSLIGWQRNWVGFENIGLLAYDDPALFEEMIETICVCVCETIPRALKDVQFDFATGWEDICFKNGPIISPKMFDKWIVPRYKRITGLLRRHGVDIAWTDCDGNVLPILDQFLAGGINCMFPVEVAAGSDPVLIREKYGRRALLHGGVDKMALLKGPKAIEKELLRIKPVVDGGGYVPHLDHLCPTNVTLENYKFYRKLKRQMFNAGDLRPHYKE